MWQTSETQVINSRAFFILVFETGTAKTGPPFDAL